MLDVDRKLREYKAAREAERIGGVMAALIVLSILIGFAIEAWKILH